MIFGNYTFGYTDTKLYLHGELVPEDEWPINYKRRIWLNPNRPFDIEKDCSDSLVCPRTVRDAHIERLRTWNIPVSERYADDVVRRVFANPDLRSHEHAHREMGMCLECDAAEAVRSLDPESSLLTMTACEDTQSILKRVPSDDSPISSDCRE